MGINLLRIAINLSYAYFMMTFGKEMYIRKMCYDAEKHGAGIVTWTDIKGQKHSVIVKAE